VADSAITTTVPVVDTEYSAFNERYVVERTRAVREGGLKIFNLGRAAVSGAGRVELITTVAEHCNQWLKAGADPAEAFRKAVDSVTPLPDRTALQAALIWKDDAGAAKLVSFNASFDEKFKEHDDDVLHLGSIDAQHRRLTQSLVDNLRGMNANDQQACAIAVGLCQSYGIHSLLMEQGIGGSFYGAYTASDKTIKWNSDLSYLIYDGSDPGTATEAPGGRAVYTYFRGNMLVSVSSFSPTQALAGKFRFRITVLGNEGTDVEARSRADEALRDIVEGIPDYFVFLDRSAPRAMIAELLGQSEHQNVRVAKLDLSTGIRRVAYREHLKDFLYRAKATDGRRPFHFERA
jgi:hypothetical protein